MTDKELIRQKIERLIEIAQAKRVLYPKTIVGAKNFLLIEDYNKLLSFIDSLPEQPISEDLNREIGYYTTSKLLKKRNNSTGVYHLTQKECDNIAHHFAEWQRNKDVEKMMKTLIRGEIVKDIHNQLSVKSEPLNDTFWKFGDKVKIIIVNEEQNNE